MQTPRRYAPIGGSFAAVWVADFNGIRIQRGNNREPCFIEPENYQFYLQLWEDISRRYGVKVHAYCLMTNHISTF